LHLLSGGLPGSLVLARRILALGLIRARGVLALTLTFLPALLIRRPRRAGLALRFSATTLRRPPWITTHTIPFDPALRADPSNYGKALRDILKPVAGELDAFKAYIIAVRANELMKADKEHLFTREEIAAGLQLGFIQSKAGILPVGGTLAGFKEVATRSDMAKLFRAFGGAKADLWKGESEQTAKTLERMARRGNFDPRTILTPAGVIRALQHLGSISEAGTRVAEFKASAQARPADVDALFDAAYNAREVSVDFGMHGANPAVRMLTRITPFLNPAMQGMYKAARTGREQFMLTLLRGSLLTAFSVALFLLNRDEDWYDDLEQWEKNVYWVFDVGLRTDVGEVIPLRVPKPFEWGALFGSVPEALADLAIEQNGGDFTKRLGSILNDVFALRAIPTALLVPLELWANKNTFTDRPIVPESKQGLDPELQHGNYASLTARELGGLTGTSPGHIDHAIRGFFGTMGVYTVMLADLAARQVGDYPEAPAQTWRQMPVVKAFVHDPDNPNSRHVNDFYELLKLARQREASMRRHYEGTPQAEWYREQYGPMIEIAKDANALARQVAQRRRENEEILRSGDHTGEEKAARLNENNAAIRQAARVFMEDARGRGIQP